MPPATPNYTPAPETKAFRVNAPNVQYTDSHILADYVYQNTRVTKNELGEMIVQPIETNYKFKTDHRVPKVGLMLVGWGGNNGSTVTASILANRRNVQWRTKEGVKSPNYYGSVVLSSTLKIGIDESGKDVFIPFNDILPMIHPNDFVIGGWDINSANIAESMERAQVLDVDLQRQLYDELAELKPLPSVYFPSFIAANQEERADNVLKGTVQEQLDELRKNIRDFKANNNLDKIIVLWTANTERFADLIDGVNDTAENLLKAVEQGHSEVSPSTLFAIASILENAPFINGSPQNTLVPGVIELAEKHQVYIGGDDFKTGQTKVKSVLVDFLVNAGIKPIAITSYNHLGNNDGKNLSAPEQFRSKEISKSNVVDDMVAANHILYKKGEHPDHVVVIKYVPSVSDSKRALDEYVSEIFMNGRNTISLYNTCEDSLLASPLIFDLAIITELMTRIQYKTPEMEEYAPFHSVLSILSYLLKAPVVPQGTPVVNALSKQRMAMENVFRACVGLPPQNEMLLEHKAI
ncbi:Myo-inositol-1-phosphate synthase [Basidiobolus ranarum]|uniref:inositol-3-phosphate synthase n=1 Tax=Basidiobolus ranarum TaxID=34480 RepID=A0ABR2X1V7_9FUNG